jgi:hypothetical protein
MNKYLVIFTHNSVNTYFPSSAVSKVINFDNSKVFVVLGNREVGLFDTKTSVYKTIDKFPEGDIIGMKWQPKTQKLYIAGTSKIHIWQQGQKTGIGNFFPKKIALRPNQDGLWAIGYRALTEIGDSKARKAIQFGYNSVQNRIFSIFEDRQNRLWIGKQDGLYFFQNDRFEPAPLIHAALKTRVEDIIEMPNGSLVFATKGNGLVIYDGKTALNLTKADGLVTDMIENIATDAKGNIWVGTLAGMNKLSPKTDGNGWNIQPITMFHGLPSNEINSIAPNTEGVFLATSKGLTFYKDKKTEVPNPSPFLNYFKAVSTIRDLSKTRIFEARENDIEIAWHGINFHINNKILYRYRLNPKDEWRYTYNKNIQFPSLKDNDHIFEVQAQNENGKWSDSLKIPFTVLPYWFETWWFRALLVVSMAIGVYLYNQKRVQRLKKEHAFALHINDLERTALAMQMNPHFIFNCLNSIQLLIQRNAKDDAMTYLSRFARLVRFTLESTRRGIVTIDQEATALDNYLTLEKLRFKEGLEFSIDVDEKIDGFDTEIPAMLIQPFVENAVKHGFSIDEKSAKISVRFNVVRHFSSRETNAGTKVPDYIFVEIKDNGKGIDRNILETKLQTALQIPTSDIQNPKNTEGGQFQEKTGVGIALSRQRLALHNGGNALDDLRIETLMGESGQILGTIVLIKIRLNNE